MRGLEQRARRRGQAQREDGGFLVGEAVGYGSGEALEQGRVLLERSLAEGVAAAVGTGGEPEDALTHTEAGDGGADRHHLARDVGAEHGGGAQPSVGDAAGALDDPVDGIDRHCAHAHEHFVSGGRGGVERAEGQRGTGCGEQGGGVRCHGGPFHVMTRSVFTLDLMTLGVVA
ncbi:hypothetical protein QE430_000300 [Microbacterium testaceum]|nr:hypothetical protein [Microbacterium testaceum]